MQINDLHLSLESLYQTIDLLKKNQDIYQLDLYQKDSQIKDLINLINSPVKTAIDNHETLRIKNDMTQFYVKVAGVFVASALVIIVVHNLTGLLTLKMFSPKVFLPTSLYTFIQDNTPFFHDIKSYSYMDNVNDIVYKVTITDDTLTSILAKYTISDDYMDISTFITHVIGKSDSIIGPVYHYQTTPLSPTLEAVSAAVVANQGTYISAAQMTQQAFSFMN
jgi:hypothetical protein